MCLTGQNHSANGAFVFQLETPVKLQSGKNYISLLSGTVGLKVLNLSSETALIHPIAESSMMRVHTVFLCETELWTFVRAHAGGHRRRTG